MPCNCESIRPNKSNKREYPGENIKWLDYPSPGKKGFGNGKICYFISCPKSERPIRDIYNEKREPHYENQSYNEYAFCNQRGIRNLKDRGGSYIIFVARYKGKLEDYKSKIYITGWFPLSKWKKIDDLPPEEWKYNEQREAIYKTRVAYKSDNPIFLSIKDSIKLDDKKWGGWFKEGLPNNLRYMTKFINDQNILCKIKNYFERMESEGKNATQKYIEEVRKMKAILLRRR